MVWQVRYVPNGIRSKIWVYVDNQLQLVSQLPLTVSARLCGIAHLCAQNSSRFNWLADGRAYIGLVGSTGQFNYHKATFSNMVFAKREQCTE